MRFLVPTALVAVICISCRYPWSPGEKSCADHARLDMPVDLQTFAAKGTIRPFGVHGGPNPEGHPGMDFILNAVDGNEDIEVKASFSAEVLSVTPEPDYPGSSCIVMDSACVEVNLCHLRLEADIKPGSKVKRGQKLGTVGLMTVESQYNLHFGTYSGHEADLVCPSDFIDPESVRCILGQSIGGTPPENCGNSQSSFTMLGRSTYPEASARDLGVKCADGTTQIFSLPAESGFCAPRLSPQDAARMNTCLGAACAGIW